MSKQCVFCHTPGTSPSRIALDVERNAVRIRVEGVPADHCSACGADAIDGPLAEHISKGIESITCAIEAAQAVPAQV